MPTRLLQIAPPRIVILCVALLASASLLAPSALAQQDSDTFPPPSKIELESRLAALPESDPAAAEYRLAIDALDRAATLSARAAEFRELATQAPGRLAEIRETLSQPRANVEPAPDPQASLADIRASEAETAAALKAAQDHAAQLAAEADRRELRRREIPELLDQARQRLAAIRTDLADQPSNARVDLNNADTALALARHAEVAAEIALLDAELASYEARRDLLPAQRDLAARRIAELEQAVAAWQTLVRQASTREAQRAAREAEELRERVSSADEIIREYAATNAELAQRLDPQTGLTAQTRDARNRLTTAQSKLEEIRRSYHSISARLNAADLNQATGRMLRSRFDQLDDPETIQRSIKLTRRQLEEAEYTLIERREARDDLRSVDDEVERLLRADSPTPTTDPDDRATAVRQLVLSRRDLLDKLVSDASRHVEALLELQRTERRLFEASSAYRSFIRERILWVRSLPADRGPRLSDLREFAAWVDRPEVWSTTLRATTAWMRKNIASSCLIIALLCAVIAAAFVAPKRHKDIATKLRHPSTDSIWLTLQALFWSTAQSLRIALALCAAGWLLRQPPEQTELGAAAGAALLGAGLVWFGFAFLRSLAQKGGLGELHFRMPPTATARVRTDSRWAGAILSLGMATMAFTDASGLEQAAATPGRLGFTISAFAASLLNYRVLRPSGRVIGPYVASGQGEWLNKIRLLWFWPLVVLPLLLALIAWLGYVYTAYQLSWLLALTLFLIVLVVFSNMLLRRWLFIARRRVAIEEARRRRAEAARQDDPATGAPPITETGQVIEEERIDLAGLSAQTRQIIRVLSVSAIVLGFVGIWGDFLPALRLLDRIELYPRLQVTEVESLPEDEVLRAAPSNVISPQTQPAPAATTPATDPGANGSPQRTSPSLVPGLLPSTSTAAGSDAPPSNATVITLADVGLAALILLITIVGVRNLPGLVEIAMLQRLPLDSGARYAIETVLRYAISIAGLFAAFSAIGISWSHIQWLAAALTFGLAFGLQEIFANFISGLIILVERPIRIGDTVTVQNISGTVTQIRMRATTILDWERKELVIPNKSFITGDIINWTLSNPVLRLSIPVGVSYSGDVDKAEELLLAAAKAESNVLSDPAPYVNFTRFGDSTLDFELRVYIPHVDYLLSVRHALHMRIIKEFRKAGVEIAFPQRDIHVRSAEGLADLVRAREQANPDNPPDNTPRS